MALSERILVFPPKLSSKPKAQLNIFASVTSTSSFTAGLSLAIAQKCLQLHEILASSLTQLIFKSTDKSNHFDLSPNSESIFGSHIMILIILIADSSWHKDLSYSLWNLIIQSDFFLPVLSFLIASAKLILNDLNGSPENELGSQDDSICATFFPAGKLQKIRINHHYCAHKAQQQNNAYHVPIQPGA